MLSKLELCCINCGAEKSTRWTESQDFINGNSGSWQVRKCLNCGFYWTSPRPTLSELETMYANGYHCFREAPTLSPISDARKRILQSHFGYFGPSRAGFIGRLSTLLGAYRERVRLIPIYPAINRGVPRLLEIGCGVGGMLMEYKQLGWEVEGIEPSSYAVQIACRAGLNVRQGTLESAPLRDSEYDCIVLNMSLEHVYDLKKGIEQIHRALAPKGQLLIAVPNISGLEAVLFRKYFHSLHLPFHLQHFTPKTLANLFPEMKMRVWYQYTHKDLSSSIEYFLLARSKRIATLWRKVPVNLLKVIVFVLAFFRLSSRISVHMVRSND